MEQNPQKTRSQALLFCGNGAGLRESLLLKPEPDRTPEADRALQTERVPRSQVLERLHSFLPQMAEANEKLRQQMEKAPAGQFDIESVEEAQRVIEMDVALVELSGSDSDSEEDDLTSEEEQEITEENLKLPGDTRNKKNKASIQVLDQQGL